MTEGSFRTERCQWFFSAQICVVWCPGRRAGCKWPACG